MTRIAISNSHGMSIRIILTTASNTKRRRVDTEAVAFTDGKAQRTALSSRLRPLKCRSVLSAPRLWELNLATGKPWVNEEALDRIRSSMTYSPWGSERVGIRGFEIVIPPPPDRITATNDQTTGVTGHPLAAPLRKKATHELLERRRGRP